MFMDSDAEFFENVDDEASTLDVPDAPEVVTAAPGWLRPLWDRRTFFKSAALGTAAAAAVLEGRSMFGPLRVYADDLSAFQCTANDVRIIGPGIVLNEPCTCNGTFNAVVSFHIINNTGTTRYCVTAHLCGSGNIPARDVVFGDIAANFDGTVTVTIPDYPCGTGLVCFGTAGSAADGSFAKGENCPAGACCSTISWNVRPNDPCPLVDPPIKSKCRHQSVCIQGRGTVTLDCAIATDGVQASCAVPCGATTTLRLCTTGSASSGPFTYVLGAQSFGPTTDTCHDFTVGPVTATTTYTGSVTDASGCTKSASTELTTTPTTVGLSVSGGETCGSGDLTFTATAGTGCTFNFKVDGVSVQNTSSNTYAYAADPDGTCHTVSVVKTCGGCVSGETSLSVSQCVTTTTDCGS